MCEGANLTTTKKFCQLFFICSTPTTSIVLVFRLYSCRFHGFYLSAVGKNVVNLTVPLVLIHYKKRLAIFPFSAGMSLTKLSLAENKINYFCQREFSYSDIPAGDGKIANLFLKCTCIFKYIYIYVNMKAY